MIFHQSFVLHVFTRLIGCQLTCKTRSTLGVFNAFTLQFLCLELTNLALLELRPFIYTLFRGFLTDHLTIVTNKASLTFIFLLDQ